MRTPQTPNPVGETPVVAMRRFLLLLALAREFYRYGVG
jgi:hypothetical protein